MLLPNSIGLVATLLGLNAFGRTAGLLNFTAGSRNLSSAAVTGPLPVVVTSRRFIELARLDDAVAALAATEVAPGRRVEIIYLEDVRSGIGAWDKAKGFLRSILAAGFHRRRGGTPDKPAVILFTSGTEGAPKGVVLTNANLVANAMQIWSHADGMLSAADTAMNPLPIFHSFGLTAGTLMPLLERHEGRALSEPAALQAGAEADRRDQSHGAVCDRHVPARLRTRGRREGSRQYSLLSSPGPSA